jgi:peptide/nickel transport system permease protein
MLPAGSGALDAELSAERAEQAEPLIGTAGLVWRRFRRRRSGMVSLTFLVVMLCAGFLSPVIVHWLGLSPYRFYPQTLTPTGLPKGSFGGISWQHPLGVEPPFGRDILARVLYGTKTSLIVGLTASTLVTILGTAVGISAGLHGGVLDHVVGRAVDTLLAFPQLLIFMALTPVLQSRLVSWGFSEGNGTRIIIMITVMTVFGWAYIARIVRGQTIQLRSREFVEAARMQGAGRAYLVWHEILPNLAGPIIVYFTLAVPTFISTEAALSFLGVGIQIPGASWGQMLGSAVPYFRSDPMYIFVPGVLLVTLVLAFNVVGDRLRDAVAGSQVDR